MKRGRQALVGGFALLLLVGLTGAPALVAAQQGGGVTSGEPDLEVYLPDNELFPGTETTVDFQIANGGGVNYGSAVEEVTTARAVTLEVEDSGPFEVKTGETPVGLIQDGQVSDVSHRIVVPEDVEPGTYDIDVRVRYEYTNRVTSSDTQRLSESDRQTITIEVPEEPEFSVSDVETSVGPGSSGDATLEIENTGTKTAYGAEATITGGSGVVIGGESAEEVLGDLEPGDSVRVTVNAEIAESVSESGAKPLDVAFTYDDEDGVEQDGDSVTASLAPAAEQTFAVSEVRSSLRVGETNTLSGTITNTGPNTADNAVVTFEDPGPTVTPIETEVAVGSLDPGESAAFEFDVEVTSSSTGGPRQFELGVRYWDQDNTAQQSDTLPTRAEVGAESPEFDVEPVNGTLGAGSGDEFRVTVTNTREYTVSDVSAKIYTDSPLSTSDDEAFIDSLEPGESTEIVFQVSADSDATAKLYPVKMDFQYDDDDGDTIVSDTYQVPLDVTEPTDSGGLPIIPIAVALLILAAAGGFLYYRRQG
ncbi:COG1361 S-layer family protein [Halobellus rarus]|uniref:COG1361 S-layer family protein n=1 Tax=Halobellus rarus TaxID=1126237 RepID=A0ABD6CJI8_9EURY|nr:COG1361 S-layer family protein [Halobellus rarus]